MKCRILFLGENEKNTINLLSADLAQRVVRVNEKAASQNLNIGVSPC